MCKQWDNEYFGTMNILESSGLFTFDCIKMLFYFSGALSAITVDGWIYAVGGSYGNRALKYAERYDSIVNQWTPVTNMRLQRSHFGLTSLNGKLYAIGKFLLIFSYVTTEYQYCFREQDSTFWRGTLKITFITLFPFNRWLLWNF